MEEKECDKKETCKEVVIRKYYEAEVAAYKEAIQSLIRNVFKDAKRHPVWEAIEEEVKTKKKEK